MTDHRNKENTEHRGNGTPGRAVIGLLLGVLLFTAGFLLGRNSVPDGGAGTAAEAENGGGNTASGNTAAGKTAAGKVDSSSGNEVTPYEEEREILEQLSFEASEQLISNPYMGLGAWANENPENLKQEISLVYVDVTWAELEPERGKFDFAALEERCQFDLWKEMGLHAVFRFVLDEPGSQDHMDIPQWLYDMTGDGTFYDISYGQGYCPDYNNETLISEHERVIEALGNRYGNDDFISFVELGSVGHWGEWHIHADAGRMPSMTACSRYYEPYKSAFPDAQLLLRRPFAFAAGDDPGLYNDTSGLVDSTEIWLDWIRNGGSYDDTGEENALSPMPDAWRSASIGGELSSLLTDKENLRRLLTEDLDQTLDLFTRSHTSWIAPGSFAKLEAAEGSEEQQGLKTLLNKLGYRLYISGLERYIAEDQEKIGIKISNAGIAPCYKDFQLKLRITDTDGKVQIRSMEFDLRKVLPEEPQFLVLSETETMQRIELCIAGQNGTEQIRLANDLPEDEGWMLVWER